MPSRKIWRSISLDRAIQSAEIARIGRGWCIGTDPSFRALQGAPCEALCRFCVNGHSLAIDGLKRRYFRPKKLPLLPPRGGLELSSLRGPELPDQGKFPAQGKLREMPTLLPETTQTTERPWNFKKWRQRQTAAKGF